MPSAVLPPLLPIVAPARLFMPELVPVVAPLSDVVPLPDFESELVDGFRSPLIVPVLPLVIPALPPVMDPTSEPLLGPLVPRDPFASEPPIELLEPLLPVEPPTLPPIDPAAPLVCAYPGTASASAAEKVNMNSLFIWIPPRGWSEATVSSNSPSPRELWTH